MQQIANAQGEPNGFDETDAIIEAAIEDAAWENEELDEESPTPVPGGMTAAETDDNVTAADSEIVDEVVSPPSESTSVPSSANSAGSLSSTIPSTISPTGFLTTETPTDSFSMGASESSLSPSDAGTDSPTLDATNSSATQDPTPDYYLLPWEAMNLSYSEDDIRTTTPTAAPNSLPSLLFVGNDGTFEVYPLSECMGDCDMNDDCAGDLICMQRIANEPVPGCQGPGEFSADYCAKPESLTAVGRGS